VERASYRLGKPRRHFEPLECRSLLSGAPPVAVDDAYRIDEHQLLSVQAAGPTTAGLVHHWKFDETSGDVANDSAGDNHGTLLNWSASEPKWVSGKFGGALVFDGGDDYLITSGSITLDRYTIAFWLRRDTENGLNARIIGPRDRHWILENRDSGRGVGFYYPDPVQAIAKPSNGVWEHYAFVFDRAGQFATMYRDGALVTSGTISRGAPLLPWVMGHHEDLNNSLDSWKGALDDVRIYNRLLSANEVSGLRRIGGVLTNDSDPEGDPLSVILNVPPEYGTLTLAADGGFTYQPAADYIGADSFTYRLSDGTSESDVATVQLAGLTFDDAPVTASDAYEVDEDSVLNVAAPGVLANDVEDEGQPMTVSLDAGPQHGTVSLSANGAFEYRPAANFFGVDTFTYVASDGIHEAGPKTVTLQVNNLPDAPLAGDDQFATAEGQPLVVDATPRLSVRTVELAATALAWDPHRNLVYATDWTGRRVVPIDPFTGSVGTAIGVASGPGDTAITDDGRYLYVGMRDLLSVAKIDLDSRTVVGQYFIGYNAEDIETLPGQPDAVVIDRARVGVSPRAAGAVIYDNGVARPIVGSGGNRVVVSTDGTKVFGLGSELSEKGIARTRVDPQGLVFEFERNLNQFGGGDLKYRNGRLYLANGLVVDANTLLPVGQTSVGGDVVTVPGTNRMVYLRQAAETMRIIDADTLADLDSVTVPGNPIVGGESGVPFGTDGIAFIAEGKVYLVQSDRISGLTQRGVLANDVDADNQALTVSPVELPEHGDLNLNADGTFEYQPEAGFAGVDRFTYQASDGALLSSVATVTITVEAINDPPTAVGDGYVIPLAGTLDVAAENGVLVNDSDPEGDPLGAALVSPPSHGVVELDTTGSFRYTPASGYFGPDSFTYKVSDGEFESAPATVALSIDAPTITIGDHRLAPNTPNQQIEVYVSGGHAISGLNLFAQVGDGGPELAQYGLPAGTDGPAITNVDLKTDTVFADVPDEQANQPGLPQIAIATIAISAPDESVAAEGMLATLTIDTTGFFAGDWDLVFSNVLPFESLGGPFRTDFAGDPANIVTGSLSIVPAEVVGRNIFYNNSSFDGNDGDIDERDDDAIATDKRPLLPGQTATFSNYTSYSRGINGIIIDVANLPGAVGEADFSFRRGNANDVSAWTSAPAPESVVVRDGAGSEGSDRIVVTWPDGVLASTWLQVTLRRTSNTGLNSDDVFYFGNAPGEIGDSAASALVNATDVIGARDHKRGPLNQAEITDPYDFNRDRLVNATDVVFARDHMTSPFTALRLITPTATQAPEAPVADAALSALTPPVARRIEARALATGRQPRHHVAASGSAERPNVESSPREDRRETSPLRAVRQRTINRSATEAAWATIDAI
jgi:VCBS repeat-containing protein